MEPLHTNPPEDAPSEAVLYQIRVQGRLDERWSEWFGAVTVTFNEGVTTLTGPVADQAALRGMLTEIWDLNLALIAVNQIAPDDSGTGQR